MGRRHSSTQEPCLPGTRASACMPIPKRMIMMQNLPQDETARPLQRRRSRVATTSPGQLNVVSRGSVNDHHHGPCPTRQGYSKPRPISSLHKCFNAILPQPMMPVPLDEVGPARRCRPQACSTCFPKTWTGRIRFPDGLIEPRGQGGL